MAGSTRPLHHQLWESFPQGEAGAGQNDNSQSLGWALSSKHFESLSKTQGLCVWATLHLNEGPHVPSQLLPPGEPMSEAPMATDSPSFLPCFSFSVPPGCGHQQLWPVMRAWPLIVLDSESQVPQIRLYLCPIVVISNFFKRHALIRGHTTFAPNPGAYVISPMHLWISWVARIS